MFVNITYYSSDLSTCSKSLQIRKGSWPSSSKNGPFEHSNWNTWVGIPIWVFKWAIFRWTHKTFHSCRIIKFEFGLVIHHNNTCGSKSWFSSIIINGRYSIRNNFELKMVKKWEIWNFGQKTAEILVKNSSFSSECFIFSISVNKNLSIVELFKKMNKRFSSELLYWIYLHSRINIWEYLWIIKRPNKSTIERPHNHLVLVYSICPPTVLLWYGHRIIGIQT